MSRSTEDGAVAHALAETEPVACDIELEGVTCTGSLVHDMKFAFHGDRLAAACIDHSVKVYEDTGHGTWELRSEWKAHKAPVLRVGWVCSCRSARRTSPAGLAQANIGPTPSPPQHTPRPLPIATHRHTLSLVLAS